MLRVSISILFLLILLKPSTGANVDSDKVYNALKEKDYQKAIDLVQKLIPKSSGEVRGNYYYLEGYAYEQMNEVGLAMRSYLKSLGYVGDNSKRMRIQNNVGTILYDLELYKEAISYFESNIQNGKDHLEETRYGYYNRSRIYRKEKLFELARLDIDKTISLSVLQGDTSLYLKALNHLDLIIRDAGNTAIYNFNHTQLLQLFEQCPNESSKKGVFRVNARRSLHNIAQYYLANGDTLTAIDKLNDALKLSVGSYKKFITIKDRGEILLKMGKVDKARSNFKSALSIVSDVDLIDKAENLQIFQLAASIETDLNTKIELLEHGNRLLTKFSKMKEDVIHLNNKNMAAMAINSHQKIQSNEQVISLLTIGIIVFLGLLILIGSGFIFYLYRKNKDLLGDVKRLMHLVRVETK